jgi:hypothetical protein
MRFGIPLTLAFLTINDEQRDREIRDHRATLYTSFRRYVEANPVYVPFATPSPLTTAVCTSLTACPRRTSLSLAVGRPKRAQVPQRVSTKSALTRLGVTPGMAQ